MKKDFIITLIVLVILVIITFAIFIMQNKSISDITMTIKEGTLTRTNATFCIKDNDKEHGYGEDYSIEKKVNEEWRPVEQIGTYSQNLIALSSGKAGNLEFNIDWSERYGELENGEYRLVKSVTINGEKREIYVEFTIN